MGFQQRMMDMMMGQMMPQMMANMGSRDMEQVMQHAMPGMMDNCFAEMDAERRRAMLRHCRDMLDQMEKKCPAA